MITMAPLLFSVSEPEFLSKFPDGTDQLWRADLKATRGGEQLANFTGILFVESKGTAFIYGIEFEDGYAKGLKSTELAKQQQAFIQFLRDQTRLKNLALGILGSIFEGHEYACEHRATAAYVQARAEPLGIGVGFLNAAGQYELIKTEPEADSWAQESTF